MRAVALYASTQPVSPPLSTSTSTSPLPPPPQSHLRSAQKPTEAPHHGHLQAHDHEGVLPVSLHEVGQRRGQEDHNTDSIQEILHSVGVSCAPERQPVLKRQP